MYKKSYHVCTLPVKDTTGLPKLPPNASTCDRFRRHIRKLFILDPKHFMCKTIFRNKTAIMEERKRHATSRYSYVIHPLSKFNIYLEAVFFLIWTYSLVCGPFDMWMGYFGFVQKYMLFPIKLIVMVLIFNVGFIDDKTKQIVIEPRKIAVRYLTSYFIFDVFSTYVVDLLCDLVAFSLNIHDRYGAIWEQIILVVRTLCCCVRINTLMDFFHNTLAILRCNKTMRIIFCHMLRTFLYIHLFAIFLFLTPAIVYNGKWPESSWLHQAQICSFENIELPVYLEALVLSTCYFFGVSYKYDMQLMSEQIIAICASFMGRLYTLYLLADVLRVFGIAGVSESMYERNMYVLQQYMVEKDLPPALQARMLKFFEFKFQRRYFREAEIVSTLSETLRTELFLFSARKLIQKVDLLKRLPNTTVGAIVASMKAETYSPRDVILKAGWENNEIYFISTGTVAVMDRQGSELSHLEDGDEFGMSCLVSKEQNYNIIAVETTEVFIIEKNTLLEFLEPYPELLIRFMRNAKQRLASFKEMEAATKETVDLISELHRGNILEKRRKRLRAY